MDRFDYAYLGVPPWDIGRPQGEIVRLAERGEISGKALDVGCGTGENVLYLARRGREVWGLDAVPAAIERARQKAMRRQVSARFVVANALDVQLADLEADESTAFETVLDCGLFHTFSDEERSHFADNLSRLLTPKGNYFMLSFSEREPGNWGPRRVSQSEIRATFADAWKINYIREATFETNLEQGEVQAWLTSISHT